MTIIRSYSELRRIRSFKDRYHYLALRGEVGYSTFGFDRWINQQFYHSREWRDVRSVVILRDLGCDLGVPGYEIFSGLMVHHMNPVTINDVQDSTEHLLNPEFLITTSLRTHNAIHYGDESQLPKGIVERTPGDTKLW